MICIKQQLGINKYRKFFCVALVLIVLLPVGCIDEDLSDCVGVYPGCGCDTEYTIDYNMELALSLNLMLDDSLTTSREQELAAVLRNDLQDILSNRARSLDLSFFATPEGELAEQQHLDTDTNRLTLSLSLPSMVYEHIAVAATAREESVKLTGTTAHHDLCLRHSGGDTLDCHRSAFYSGTAHLDVNGEKNSFYVPLYMQNAVAILVIDPTGSPAEVKDTYLRGSACGFACADSTFLFDSENVIRHHRSEGGGLIAYHAVCFPSRDEPLVRAAEQGSASLWEMDVYTQLPDGSYVKNTLSMRTPLEAGCMRIIKVSLDKNGEIVNNKANADVGVSVTLDWKPGGDYDIEM